MRDEVGFGLRRRGADRARRLAALDLAALATAIRATSRSASASASCSPPRWPPSPDVLLLDEPTRGMDPARRGGAGRAVCGPAATGGRSCRHARPGASPPRPPTACCTRRWPQRPRSAGPTRTEAVPTLTLLLRRRPGRPRSCSAGPAGLRARRRRPREIALVATLAAAAAAGRVLFAAIPSAQPVTTICACHRHRLGPARRRRRRRHRRPGLQRVPRPGPVDAVADADLGPGRRIGRVPAPAAAPTASPLVAFGVVWGFLFGAIMNIWQLAAFGPAFNLPAFVATRRARPARSTSPTPSRTSSCSGSPGPALIRLLDRYGRRLRVELVADPAPP